MLHILTNSPYKRDIKILISMINHTDSFIAIQDGIFIALRNSIFLNEILIRTKKLYVLKEDVLSRGVLKYISSMFKVVNYSKFVNLTVKNKLQMNW
ncbi:sulfurtransferase complex subunit TusB [Buchnera aphidicola (Mollitrichosiphum nigrofasciatum)]|uniref:sulfurtransferase complex subunit TusB n=1 Tax=Buchnera aphidicola TaxID=9 RepID=UPI0031B8883D